MAQINETSVSPELIAEAVRRAMASMGQPGGRTAASAVNQTGKLQHQTDYPLAEKRPELVKSASGMGLTDITLEKVSKKEISFGDIKIRPETLEYQAQIAESIGRPRLAANMRRAAEMTRIPDERILEMYNAIRPYRSTKAEMLAIADELDTQYQAKTCANFVREATQVYEQRGRLKK